MRVFALDIGSSSVKAAIVHNGQVRGPVAVASFPTRYTNNRAEVSPRRLLEAIRQAVSSLDESARKKADLLSLATMAPAWLAMDANGRPITPIVTHQDRRSEAEALALERRVGRARHLSLCGNRPFPGGISSTTVAWFAAHQPQVLRAADLVGHLPTWLIRRWTAQRVIDPSNASFTGTYRTLTLGGWCQELLEAAGLHPGQMPAVLPADTIAGHLVRSAARELALPAGLPVLPGIVDTSAAIWLNGAEPGTLLNVSGSTDVLALNVKKPVAHERLLTRALGVGERWVAASTLASAGSTLAWLHRTFYSELGESAFHRLLQRTIRESNLASVVFEPYLAGDRMSIEQRRGAFAGLSLGTTREQMVAGVLDALAKASANRLALLEQVYGPISRTVVVSGGVGAHLGKVMHRDWPGRWRIVCEPNATLRGLFKLGEQAG